MSSKLNGLVWECEIKPIARKAVLARLADFSNEEGYSWPAVDTLRRNIGAESKNTVTAALKALEKEGWVKVIRRKDGGRDISNAYQLNVEKIEEMAERERRAYRSARKSAPSKNETSKSNPLNNDPSDFDHSNIEASNNGESGGQQLRGEGSAFDPDPSLDPNTDPSDKKPSCPAASQQDDGKSPDDFISRHPDAVVYSVDKRQWGTQDDLTCAKYIWKKIIRMYEDAAEKDGEVTIPKDPDWALWANEVRLMRSRDGRTHRQICELYNRVSQDDFWKKVVISPSSLRDKWDDLMLKLSVGTSRPKGAISQPREDWLFPSKSQADSTIPEGFRG